MSGNERYKKEYFDRKILAHSIDCFSKHFIVCVLDTRDAEKRSRQISLLACDHMHTPRCKGKEDVCRNSDGRGPVRPEVSGVMKVWRRSSELDQALEDRAPGQHK